MYTVTTKAYITPEDIADLMVTAIEGGSGYWLGGMRKVTTPTDWHRKDDDMPWYSDPDFWAGDFCVAVRTVDYDPVPRDDRDPIEREQHLTPAKITAGLQIMADEYPDHFADLLQDNVDAATADVFLQCCVLGEIVYG